MSSRDSTISWLSLRVRLACGIFFFVGSLFPPYVPKAALAPQEVSIATPQFLLVEEGFLMKSASLSTQGARRAYAEGVIHTVKEGESVGSLAKRYSINNQTIEWANDLTTDSVVTPGDELLILPVDGVLHTVSRGQSLSLIAELYDIEAAKISEQNKLDERGLLLAGQELIIPDGKPVVEKPKVVVAAQPAQPKPTEDPIEVAKKPEDIPKPEKPKSQPKYTPTPSRGVLQKPCSAECFYTQHYHASHFGVDMQERGGGPIYSAEAGRVIRADYGWNGGYGNVIEVDHGNELVTLYAHNKELYVGVGDIISRGQMIAWMGNTGLVYGKTGIHLHFEVRLRGVKKNPLLYLQ